MSRVHSSDTSPGKPAKPYEGFPLFPHATGRWCKKIRGRLVYFGKVADGWEPALAKYDAEKEALHAGKRPREKAATGTTIKDLCNEYWNAKRARVENGEITQRWLIDCEGTTD